MRFLESNPMQAALYVMILLDACVVIAEILLDLHAMRSRSLTLKCKQLEGTHRVRTNAELMYPNANPNVDL